MKQTYRMLTLAVILSSAMAAQASDRQVLKQETPEYPAVLKKLKIGGTVKLSALVAADGTVKKTRIQGGNPMLGEVASSAVSKWKFTAASEASSVPVEMTFDAKTASVSVK